MEFLSGEELLDRIIAKTRYTEEEARPLATNLLVTAAFLASKGVVHRDIKPENIMMVSGSCCYQ